MGNDQSGMQMQVSNNEICGFLGTPVVKNGMVHCKNKLNNNNGCKAGYKRVIKKFDNGMSMYICIPKKQISGFENSGNYASLYDSE